MKRHRRRQAGTRSRGTSHGLEALECRQLLSGAVSSVWKLQGGIVNDEIEVRYNAETKAYDFYFDGGVGASRRAAGVSKIVIDARSGNDTVTLNLAGHLVPVVVHGGEGNDTINGGAEDDTIFGDEGDDTLNGGAGRDVISGGVGIDTINGGEGNDIINGGDGNDELHGDGGNDVIVGAAGADIAEGGDGDDMIRGGAAGDTLRGNNGNDWIHGDAGDDLIEGGAGDDYLSGDLGKDTIDGGEGDDRVFGGVGDDTMAGGVGRDRLNSGKGADAVYRLKGTDVAVCDATDDVHNQEGLPVAPPPPPPIDPLPTGNGGGSDGAAGEIVLTGAQGSATIRGGVLTLNGGGAGSGILNLTGGTLVNGGGVLPGGTGTLSLSGGTVQGGGGVLSLSGGLIRFAGGSVTGSLNINSGSANFTNGSLSLTAGSLTLSGQTGTGPITVITSGTSSFSGTVLFGGTSNGTPPQLTIHAGSSLYISGPLLAAANINLGPDNSLNISPNALNVQLVVTLSDEQYAQVGRAGVQAIKGVTIQSPIISGNTLSGQGQVTLA